MPLVAALLALLALAACGTTSATTASTAPGWFTGAESSHQRNVTEDVAAIMQGMAHAQQQAAELAHSSR
jgi:hypothetical protein